MAKSPFGPLIGLPPNVWSGDEAETDLAVVYDAPEDLLLAACDSDGGECSLVRVFAKTVKDM